MRAGLTGPVRRVPLWGRAVGSGPLLVEFPCQGSDSGRPADHQSAFGNLAGRLARHQRAEQSPERRRTEQTAQPSGGSHHIAKSVARPLTGRGIRLLLSAESAVQLVAKPSQPAEAVAYLIE